MSLAERNIQESLGDICELEHDAEQSLVTASYDPNDLPTVHGLLSAHKELSSPPDKPVVSVTSSTPNTRALLKCKTPERSMTGRMTSRSIENDPVSVRRFCTEKTSEPDYNGGMMSTSQLCISAVIFVVLYMILLETTLCIQYLSYIHVCLSNALPTCDC